MKEIPLANGRGIALVDDADYAALADHKWHCTSHGYAARMVCVNGRRTQIRMHRELLGVASDKHVDHADGNKLNNTRTNLRACSQQQNNRNVPARAGRRFKGITRHTQCVTERWQARIRHDGIQENLGLFRTAEDAARAYDTAATKHFGEFARLNFPEQHRLAS